jgi:hypothetical protein
MSGSLDRRRSSCTASKCAYIAWFRKAAPSLRLLLSLKREAILTVGVASLTVTQLLLCAVINAGLLMVGRSTYVMIQIFSSYICPSA